MQQSGIQYGDRILWVDGDLVFSGQQLSHLLNDSKVLLTIERNGKMMQVRVPRVPMQELKLDPEVKEELTDWQYEAELNNIKLRNLYVIPYNLTNDGIVQNRLKFIDSDNELAAFPSTLYSANEQPLQPNDKIIAIDGTPVTTSYALLKELQQHRVNIIVERNGELTKKISWDMHR